jgi:hypothetical protein
MYWIFLAISKWFYCVEVHIRLNKIKKTWCIKKNTKKKQKYLAKNYISHIQDESMVNFNVKK